MSTHIEIYIAKPKDAAGIYNVQRTVWLTTYPNSAHGITMEAIERKFPAGSAKKIQAKRDSITELQPDRQQWVAKDLDATVGWIVATRSSNSGQIRALYVLPEYQGQHIGTRLMETALAWIGKNKSVSLEVASYNEKAINFYRRWDFEPTGIIPLNPSDPLPEIVIPHLGMARSLL